jgi:HSP90 family molecular chaperone|nr:MAG TPA: hypothetical protein [Caudoviricetes sp.]DAH12969.1 MAG TPA: hypothetical protein [Caudoviricetes sp.]
MSGGKNIRQHFEKDTPHQEIFDKAKRDCGKFLILAESQKMRFSKTKLAKNIRTLTMKKKDNQRKEKIIEYLKTNGCDIGFIEQAVDEFVFLENRLTELRKLPFIQFHPKNKKLQKATPASKQYKELLQQYTNLLKVLSKFISNDEQQESPLREWVEKYANKE